jgi:hypothetical protein
MHVTQCLWTKSQFPLQPWIVLFRPVKCRAIKFGVVIGFWCDNTVNWWRRWVVSPSRTRQRYWGPLIFRCWRNGTFCFLRDEQLGRMGTQPHGESSLSTLRDAYIRRRQHREIKELDDRKGLVWLEILTAVVSKVATFWDIALSSSCTNQRFGGTYHLHLLGSKSAE